MRRPVRDRRTTSLRRRLTLLLCLHGVLLAAVPAVLVPGLATRVEDALLERHLRRAIEDHGAGVPLPPSIRPLEAADLPAALLREAVRLGPGVHELPELAERTATHRSLFIAVEESGNDASMRRWVFDATRYEVVEEFERPWAFFVLGSVLLALLLLVSASVFALRSVFRRLRAWEQHLRSEQRDPRVDDALRELLAGRDEIGSLARAWAAAREDLNAALERERRFTGDASHELRTPLAVIRGAAELATTTGRADGSDARLWDRVRRAQSAMEELVEVFLLLGRRNPIPEEWTSVRSVIEELRSEIPGLRERLELGPIGDSCVPAPRVLVRTTLRNVLENALQHGGDGRIRVDGDEQGVVVTNRTPQSGGDESGGDESGGDGDGGHGLGLEIVDRILERVGGERIGPTRIPVAEGAEEPTVEEFRTEIRFGRGPGGARANAGK